MNLIVPYKDREIDFSKPVQVYRNLTRKDVRYSIRQSGKVVAHTNRIALECCFFVVNEKGRQWVLKNKRKTVHAYCQGLASSFAVRYCSSKGWKQLIKNLKFLNNSTPS